MFVKVEFTSRILDENGNEVAGRPQHYARPALATETMDMVRALLPALDKLGWMANVGTYSARISENLIRPNAINASIRVNDKAQIRMTLTYKGKPERTFTCETVEIAAAELSKWAFENAPNKSAIQTLARGEAV